MKAELSMKGKVVLVTGGGTGLGKSIAEELVDLDADVIIAGRREDLLQQAAQEIGVKGYRKLDLNDHDSIPAFVEELEAAFGPVYGLVNNAGAQNNKPALQFEVEDFKGLFSTNVFGTYLLTRELGRRMVERGTGSILFITSATSHIGVTNNLAYTGTKGALSSMCRSFASELSPKGVRVNALAPGWVETALVKESLRRVPERREMVLQSTMMGRLGTEKDIGMAAAYMISPAASYITAAELRVDGGVTVSL